MAGPFVGRGARIAIIDSEVGLLEAEPVDRDLTKDAPDLAHEGFVLFLAVSMSLTLPLRLNYHHQLHLLLNNCQACNQPTNHFCITK
jgi:hypothetical protein